LFDLRYHVASLAAVFIALIIGILVGVGLAGSGVTKEAELKSARIERDKASALAESRLTQLQALGETKDTYENAFETAYPRIMDQLLTGKRIAVLFVGPADGGLSQTIDRTLRDAGAEPPVRVVSVSVPVDAKRLDDVLADKGPRFASYVGKDAVGTLGTALAAEFQAGGQTPLWKGLARQLVGYQSGDAKQPADGVVVVRTAKPQQGETARFLRGLYSGLAASGVPVIGIETSDKQNSAVEVFRDRGLSTVDDVDVGTGRVALALLLAGAVPGRYGTADGADAVLPKLPGA
jgi:Copper transport outer membrane protein, MctB